MSIKDENLILKIFHAEDDNFRPSTKLRGYVHFAFVRKPKSSILFSEFGRRCNKIFLHFKKFLNWWWIRKIFCHSISACSWKNSILLVIFVPILASFWEKSFELNFITFKSLTRKNWLYKIGWVGEIEAWS